MAVLHRRFATNNETRMAHEEHSDNAQSGVPDGLRLMRQCPLCRKDYTEEALSLIEERDGASLVHVTCSSCHNAVLAVVMVSPLGMSSMGVVTDLSIDDVAHFRGRDIFSQDDVLDFYSAIQHRGALERAVVAAESNQRTQ